MRNRKDGILRLDDIHPQWRVDRRSFTSIEGGLVSQEDQIECLIKGFHGKYKQMPLVQKEDSRRQIAQLLDSAFSFIIEPTIQPHKGRPLGSKKRKADSSTRRDPSAFEIVEKNLKM